MKKILIALLVLIVILGLSACNKKEEIIEEKKESEVVGGWTKVEDGTITEDLQKIFDKAVGDIIGVSYKPIKLLETQLVSGTNYKFLAELTATSEEPTTWKAVVEIYEDLQGNVSLTSVTDYTE